MSTKRARDQEMRVGQRLRPLAVAVLASLPLLASVPGHAAPFNISSVPLDLGGTLEPNLMYIHDDSGSMYWSYLPDEASSNSVYATSSTRNLQYYNPDVTYLPPVDHEGNSLGNASFTAAWLDGYDLSGRASNVVNLSTSFRATWGYAGSWIGSSQAAYYHRFSPPRPGCSAPGNVNDTDCYVKVVVPLAERQNFANWYSYYRTRNYSAKAGISRAFASLGEGIRVGYGRINKGTNSTIDGKSVPVIVRGVRAFEGTARKQFYDWLFDVEANGNTPLPRSLDAAGSYFENDHANGPWSTTPGVSGGNHLSCRKSFTILMTDGYYNTGYINSVGNADGSGGPTVTGPGGASHTYVAKSPFSDDHSNSLGDIAMHYWKRDLSSLANRVPTTATNPAFWQHMVTYGIGFGVTGSIDPDTAFDAISSGATITWPAPTSNAGKIDDLLHAGVNSRGGFFSANNPSEFADALTKTLAAINAATSSASAATVSSPFLTSNTLVYQAIYNSGDWTGKYFAFKIDSDTGQVITPPAWEASEKIPAHGSRNIYTWRPAPETNPARGADFTWSDLSTVQKEMLDGSSDVLNYLRGDKSKEGSGTGEYRVRNSKLGDIVNSTSAYVGTENFGYGNSSSIPTSQQNSYKSRLSSSAFKNRPHVIYVGANDGMLHALDAETGVERFAYVPATLFNDKALAFLADKAYTHRYYVDGSPRAQDAWINNSWRTVLVGSTGAGGRSYFALDIENPASFTKSNVLWEFEHAELGYTIGQASVVRTVSGHWVAIFGNGYNSNSHKAQLFVVDVATGALLKVIDTGVGNVTSPNGLGTPIAVDVDSDGSADIVYAGDMHGNLWKFNFSGTNVNSWDVAFKQGSTAKPFFKAVGPNGEIQPITGKPQAALHPERGMVVYFGTGKFFEVGDQGAVSDVQSLYGILDECMEKTSGQCGSASGAAKILRSQLLEQEIIYEGAETFTNSDTGVSYSEDVRVVTNEKVTTSHDGFYLDLLSPANGKEGERYIQQPRVWFDRVQYVTLLPDPDPCSSGSMAWVMELNPFYGGRTKFSPFDLNRDNSFDDDEFVNVSGEDVPVSGRRTPGGPSAGGSPEVQGQDGCYRYYTPPGQTVPVREEVPCIASPGRRSWRQLR